MVDIYNRWIPDYPGQTPQSDMAYMSAVRRGMPPTINTNVQPQMPTAAVSGAVAPQAVTPPTIHADLIQIGDESEVSNWPASVGAPRGFILRDETKIIFKAVGPDGAELPLDVYVKQPPKPVKATFDPDMYVRRDEVREMVDAAILDRITAQEKKGEKK